MDFPFSLNAIFPPEVGLTLSSSAAHGDVIKVGNDLLPVVFGGGGHSSVVGGCNLQVHLLQQRVSEILDTMGEASASAQGLRQPITSGPKLRMQEGQQVYLLVNRSADGRRGSSVVGMIKVGRKNLFLSNGSGDQVELNPLCVLDIYVHESRQRSGCGKFLFEAMMKDQKVASPRFLAIDRPSPKLVSFLAKHYGLTEKIPQFNNYVIFEGFFTDRPFDASPGPKRTRIYMGKLQHV